MCGIAGVFGPFTENHLSQKIDKMCAAIHHRGPDDRGSSTFPEQTIGMTRLSIIDLAGGHQPIWIDHKVGIVFNGEIYNYAELRKDLIKRGASFTTHSDTEVILQLYYLEGIAGLDKLEGMYGICLLDRRLEKAFLIRDPVGIKPFYFGNLDGGFYFSSEIKSILAACDKKPAINMQGLDDYLTFRYVPGPQTIWQHIHKLQPGHRIEYDLNNHTYATRQYWAPNFNSAPLDPSRDYEKEFEQLFLKSVDQQLLAADVPVGAFLSGGLDSSAICAAAVELGHTKFHTYSVAFQGDQNHSELGYANMVAEHLGTHHHDVFVTMDDFTDFMEQQPWYTDEPMADLTSVPLYFLSKEAKKDVKAVLSGEGADEFLAGYHYDKFARMTLKRQKQLSWVPRPAFSMASHLYPKGHMRQRVFSSLGKHGWQGFIRPYVEDYLPQFSHEDKKRLWLSGTYENSRRINQKILRNCPASHPMDLEMSLKAHHWLVEDLLMKSDKMTMAASLESRVPFLSRQLMEWCCSLPFEWKVGSESSGFSSKRILRQFSARRLPEEIIHRPKKGFPIPVYQWLPNQLKAWAEDILFHQNILDDWFDMQEIRILFEKAMQGNTDHQNNLFLLITLAFWKRKWL